MKNEQACIRCGLIHDPARECIFVGGNPKAGAMDKQEGGNHYKDMKIQPVEFIHANNIPYMEGNAIKYLCRWRNKNGLEDLRKAKHYIDLLLELETKQNQ